MVTLELDITAAAAAPGEETKHVKIQLHHNHRQILTSAGSSVLMHFIFRAVHDGGVKTRLSTNTHKVYKSMCGGLGITLN